METLRPPTLATAYAIRQVDRERPCSRSSCKAPTRWRVVYLYQHEGSVHIPRCPLHLVTFAAAHHLPVPREASRP
jgi:hypothetical protein